MAQAARQIKKHLRQKMNQTETVTPGSESEIITIFSDSKRYPSPIRTVGSNSASTRCNRAIEGTILRTSKLNQILSINFDSVTVQTGVRMRDLANELANHDLELDCGCDAPDRTVGGAISSGSTISAIPGDGGHLSSIASSMTLITPEGRRLVVGENFQDLIRAVRLSYGLLGCITSVTLRTRPIRPCCIEHERFDFAEFQGQIESPGIRSAGIKFYLLPFRDRVFIELRRYSDDGKTGRGLPWKIRDWACNAALPTIIRSVSRIIPIRRIRYPVIDGVSEATQILVNNTFVETGSNSMEQTGRFRKLNVTATTHNCTWIFPAKRFGFVVSAYRKFCLDYYQYSGFRCDLPAIGFRINQDDQSLLSPTFDGDAFAISTRTNKHSGWPDFVLELAEFAVQYDGIPLLNQTPGATSESVSTAYQGRLEHFRNLRRHLDPDNRMLNQFFAETIG